MTFLNVTAPGYEHHRDPLGIGESVPRLSWTVRTDLPGWAQRAYEIELDDGTATGPIESEQSVLVSWPGTALTSRERRGARVRVYGHDDSVSGWSPWSWVEAGLLEAADWRAEAAAPPVELLGAPDGPAPLLRREFTLRGPVASARLYVTAHGLYEVELNGRRVGDDVLAPGWTSYSHRLRYRTFDVTELLHEGGNAVGAWLADGWYRGKVGFEGGRTRIYGERTALIAQLEIRYADGTSETVVTDGGWRCAPGPVTAASLYEGERHDARLEQRGWSLPGFDDSAWQPVCVLGHDPALLVAPSGPPVRRIEQRDPVKIVSSPSGKTILDFGQNIAGRLRLRVRGEAGRTVTLRHAEVLEDGELCVRPLRAASSVDAYTLRGEGVEEWEPRFTLHGFRYAEVDGWPGPIEHGAIHAVVCHTGMERTGWFDSSDETLDRLHENVLWSMRGNFVDIPTDCPQRDERLGWTGDIQVFAPTATFLYDCAGMLASWLADLAAEQAELGTVPVYVPWIPLLFPAEPVAAWGDAAVIVPWTLYERYGDPELLRRQYPSMRAWVDQCAERAGDGHLWDSGFQLGDWLDPAAPPDRPFDARTDRSLVATAYLARSARLLSQAAAVLGEEKDHRRYDDLADRVCAAFDTEYVSPSGRLVGDSQTAYALALRFGLISGDGRRARAGRRLVELVRESGHRIGTGFVGTPLICDALVEAGAADDAYHLLMQRECPSWLYPVTMGATTVWERWDSLLPDGSVNPGDMTSFNHYALGAVADWLHRTVAGLAPAAPGYRRILVRPLPGGGLRHASAAHRTPYGRAEVRWERAGGRLDLEVVVPAGATATVVLPGEPDRPVEVGAGHHRFTCAFRDAADDPVAERPGFFGPSRPQPDDTVDLVAEGA
ncbi:glycoside hydrolase family 78 protein [Planomonospora parontospora]|uniref:glycoside hydrolase family 78 protein n=1 Tax=Planomonospora parontospora TaxID=58119 RepID=UPI001988E70F|nr:glycoside hydrolase family 78 protein [Planomonospora parontospora]GGL43346.1 alpha-L-rhamnosidase [Planomonospora parontospora subsp. antibiotica]GII18491.1 alpha-L-rhamnosidase [Planomonospora parontospora subsp. antibiotica]